MTRTGLSRRTVARWIAWWHTTGHLRTAEHGTRPEHRRGATIGEANHAAVYTLRTPARPKPVEHSASPDQTDTPLRSSRREEPQRAREWDRHQRTRTRADERAAGNTLTRLLGLPESSQRAVTSATRRLLRAGWTIADLHEATTRTPDGSLRWHTQPIRHPHGWLTSRLQAWDPRTPPATTRAHAAARERARDRALQEDLTRARQNAVPAPTWFTQARIAAGLRPSNWQHGRQPQQFPPHPRRKETR